MEVRNNSSQNSIYFNGKHILKLSSKDVTKACEIENLYDNLSLKISKQCGPYRTVFRKQFPQLYTGERIKGFQLFTTDTPTHSQFHLYKYSSKAPLTLRVYEGKDKNLLFSCNFDKNKSALNLETTEEFDKNIKEKKQNIIDIIKLYTQEMIKEFNLLIDYSNFYQQIKENLHPNLLKSEIEALITQAQNKLKDEPSYLLITDSLKLPVAFTELKNKLDYKKSALEIKKAFYKEGEIIESKGLRFYKNDGSSVTYTPIQSAEDDRVYRLQIFTAENILENVLIGFKDGSFATLKDKQKPNDTRKNNLVKLSEKRLLAQNIKEELDFVAKKFQEFSEFVDKYISTHKFTVVNGKYEVKDMTEYLAQKEILKFKKEEEKELIKKQLKEEKKEIKSRIKKEALKKKEELKIKIKKEKEIEKEKIKLAKKAVPVATLKKPSILTKEILNDTLLEINNIFSTPVEQRSARFSHERLSNGNIFSGKFFVTLPDKTQISVTRIKSPRYVDWEYYSIKIQKGNEQCIMNLDTTNAGIITSTKEGKPILKGAKITYTPMSEFAEQDTFAPYMPYYLNELFKGEVKIGRIIDSKMKLHKKISPEEILNAELPPLDNL